MSRTDEELRYLFAEAFPDDVPDEGLWDATRASVRRRARARRVMVAACVVLVGAVAVALPTVVLDSRGDQNVDFADTPPASPEPDVSYTEKPIQPAPSVAPEGGEPATPAPEPDAEPEPEPPGESPVPAQPARVEIRDYRLVLLGPDGDVLQTLYGDYDPDRDGPEYAIGDVALRPGSTTRDLAVAFVDGYMARALSVVVVVDGGEPALIRGLGLADHEDFPDDSPMAEPAPAWSPDGGMLAWLQPDGANRAMLHARAWSGSGPAGEATPAGGIAVDPDGLMEADETRGLALVAWEPGERLVARSYLPYEGGAERRYVIGVTRADVRVQAGTLERG